MREILLTSAAMKAADAFHIEYLNQTSLGLQERAAAALVEEVKEHKHLLVLAGAGNNGADGIAAARMLAERYAREGSDRRILLIMADPKMHRVSEEFSIQLSRMRAVQYAHYQEYTIEEICQDLSVFDELQTEEFVAIDALFGVGLKRKIVGDFATMITWLNESRCYVIAADAPSGISCDDGAVLGVAVRANVTVTFGYHKIGLFTEPGRSYVGDLKKADIGFFPDGLERLCVLKQDALMDCGFTITGDGDLPRRFINSNKGSYGKLLIIAGSLDMAGAAYFSGAAAYASGTGLVRILTPRDNRVILQTQLPEAVLSTYDPTDVKETLQKLQEALGWATHILLGPGLGMSELAGRLVAKTITTHQVPLLIDADGINLLAKQKELLKYLTEQDVLTPHFGELSRLLGRPIAELKNSTVASARQAAALTDAVVLLKDSRTVVVQKNRLYVNQSGNNGMSTAGSGDVLSGMIGGFLAGGMEAYEATINGAYLHGLIGDATRLAYSEYAVTAGRMIKAYQEILAQ